MSAQGVIHRISVPATQRQVRLFWQILFVVTMLSFSFESAHGNTPTFSQADQELLAQHDVELTSESVTTLLKSLHRDPELDRTVRTLIAQLGSESFQEREAATRALANIKVVPTRLLEVASKSTDRETALRATKILRGHLQRASRWEQERPQLFAAACRAIVERRLQVKMPLLASLLREETDPHAKGIAIEAIVTTATQGDLDLIREMIDDNKEALRIAGIRAFGRVAPNAAREALPAMKENASIDVHLAITRTMLELGDRSALASLVGLLRDDNPETRARALQILRAATGVHHQFNPYLNPADQTTPLALWDEWLDTKSAEAKLQLPLRLAPLAENLTHGLLSHFDFDVEKEGTFQDMIDPKRRLSTAGQVELVDGVDGNALHLEGAGVTGTRGGHAEIPFIDFNTLPAFTLSIWVREKNLTHEHGEAYVVYGFDQGATFDGSLCIGHFFNEVHFRTGGGWVGIPFEEADRDRWTHYAMAVADGKLRVFKNGHCVATVETTVKVAGTEAALGRHWWANGTTSSTRFQGAIDELRVYNRAMTNEQVRWLFERSKSNDSE